MIHRTAQHPLTLAMICAVGMGLTACENAESRNAPADQTETTAGAPAVPAGTQMTFTVDEVVSAQKYTDG